jgi:hypothetical protein
MSTPPRLTAPSGAQPVGGAAPGPDVDERMQALQDAADAALLAPSVHGSQPWTIVLHRDRLELRADRARQLMALDPSGRERRPQQHPPARPLPRRSRRDDVDLTDRCPVRTGPVPEDDERTPR